MFLDFLSGHWRLNPTTASTPFAPLAMALIPDHPPRFSNCWQSVQNNQDKTKISSPAALGNQQRHLEYFFCWKYPILMIMMMTILDRTLLSWTFLTIMRMKMETDNRSHLIQGVLLLPVKPLQHWNICETISSRTHKLTHWKPVFQDQQKLSFYVHLYLDQSQRHLQDCGGKLGLFSIARCRIQGTCPWQLGKDKIETDTGKVANVWTYKPLKPLLALR